MKRIFCLLLTLTCTYAFATKYTFSGNGSWSVSANWAGGIIPPSSLVAGDLIEIDGSGVCLLDVNLSIPINVTLHVKAAKSLNVAKFYTLTISGNLTCYGTLSNSGTINALQTIYMEDGSALQNSIDGEIALQDGGEIFFSGAGTFVNNGVINNGGFGIYLGPVILQNNGVITGSSGIQGLTSNNSTGTIQPGNGVGNLYFTSLTTSGTIDVELGGNNPTSQYDVITAFDNVTLSGGTLNISLANGFLPRGTQSFTIVLNGAHLGTFSQVNFPVLTGVTWSIQYLSDRIIIHTLSTLPVRYLSFTGHPIRDEVELRWSTAQEQDNAGFNIERSNDGIIWSSIGFRGARMDKTYSFVDNRPFVGMNYYRLKQKDNTGNASYSDIIKVRTSEGKWGIYPNPAQNSIWITGNINAGTSIKIFSMAGSLIKSIIPVNGYVDISNLSPSMYLLQIGKNENKSTHFFIKN